jgi:hypothetical protein
MRRTMGALRVNQGAIHRAHTTTKGERVDEMNNKWEKRNDGTG